jgi:outer membrane protein OmpA-like peptidoglycan-associated protein
MFAPKPPPPKVSETVDIKTTWVDGTGEKQAPESDTDFSERLAAPTLSGPIGLLHTLTAEPMRQHNFRVSFHIGGFKASSFLIAGTNHDTNGHVSGDLTLNYTPWKYIELYISLFNASNQNVRTDPQRTDPEVILSLGDLAFGIKGRYTVAKFIDLGLHLGVKFLNSVSGISFDGASTNFSADAIADFDLRRNERTKKVPLRFIINFGFLYDGSLKLLPAGQCANSTGRDSCIMSRVVDTYAYGIGTSRFRIRAAVDAPIVYKKVGINPYIEYIVDASVGSGDQTIVAALKNDSTVSTSRLTNPAQQMLAIGLRLRPIAGLILDAAVDVGLQSPGFQYGPPVPPWQVYAGLAYAYDPISKAGKTKIVEKTVVREVSRAPIVGRVRGIVRDAATKKPLANAVIKYGQREAVTSQITGEDGTFLSYQMPPGPITLEVSRDDYEPMKLETTILANGETPTELLLTAKPPAAGQLRIKVTDDKGGSVAATVRLTSSTGSIIDADLEGPGSFVAKLPAGDYTVDVVADAYLARQRQINIQAGQLQTLDVQLTKKPAQSHVSIGKGEIAVKGVIHFGTNNAEIKLDGQQLLDEVADVLIRNPQIKKIRIEGHTDNRGVPEKNMQLSKDRAAAVKAYLIKVGVDPLRLDSEGYGATQPLVPNLTPANRTKNRRVAFKILEG